MKILIKCFLETLSQDIKQLFCDHKYMEYNNIKRVDGKYIERWLICKKCSHHRMKAINVENFQGVKY